MRSALRCVTPMHFTLERLAADTQSRDIVTYSLTLSELRPVRLGGRLPLALMAGLHFRIEPAAGYVAPPIRIMSYFYSLCAADGTEALTFQWTPEATEGKTFPHLHVGRAVVSDKTLVMPDRFHKVHVPTGHVTLAAVIRLAIEEFRVKPLARRWREALARAGRAEVAGRAG